MNNLTTLNELISKDNQTDLIIFCHQFLSNEELKEFLILCNKEYRKGTPLIPDKTFDILENIYKENNPISIDVNMNWDNRKQNLPILMSGLIPVKTIDQLQKWAKNNNISLSTLALITLKLDGLSLLVDEETKQAWTSGDGEKGQRSDIWYKELSGYSNYQYEFYSIGEVIISKKNFEKYKDKFSNGRNMIAGVMNSKDLPSKELLSDIDYIRYTCKYKDGIERDKKTQIEDLNKLNSVQLPYIEIELSKITDELINDLFTEWSMDYEIDGLVIDINDKDIRSKLGIKENTFEPNYAVKFKGDFEEIKESEIISITDDINKFGYFTPVIQINPVSCNGAVVSNVTASNYKFINDIKLKIGSKVTIKRSGMVIPKLVSIDGEKIPYIDKCDKVSDYEKDFNILMNKRKHIDIKLREECPHCKTKLVWNDSNVHLMCPNSNCDGIKFKNLVSFFTTLKTEEVNEPTIEVLYKSGYKSVLDILSMSKQQFLKLPKFQERKSETVFTNIHKAVSNITVSQLQHASGLFEGLGEKKLDIFNNYISNHSEKELLNELNERFFTKKEYNEKLFEDISDEELDKMEMENELKGISSILAKKYLDNIDKFKLFYESIKQFITFKMESKTDNSNKDKFVFTGFRDTNLKLLIEQNNGVVLDSLTKECKYLVVKDINSNSSKVVKAKKDGIKILSIDNVQEMFKL